MNDLGLTCYSTFRCAECGKVFGLPVGCMKKDYVYKVLKYGVGGDHYYMCCSWTCYKKFKTKLAQAKIMKTGHLSGHSAEEAENWLKWAKAELPDKTKRSKYIFDVERAQKKKTTCMIKVMDKYDEILELYLADVPWKYIRIRAGLAHWSVDLIKKCFSKIHKGDKK